MSGATLAFHDPIYGEIVQFLYYEAELLDTHQFGPWLGLLDEDVSYRVATASNAAGSPTEGRAAEIDVMRDNLASLRVRVERLGTGYAWAEQPPSRTRHLVSNVRVRATPEPDAFETASYIAVYRSRGSSTTVDLFSGERQDLLRRIEGHWRLCRRVVRLDQAVVGARNISIFL